MDMCRLESSLRKIFIVVRTNQEGDPGKGKSHRDECGVAWTSAARWLDAEPPSSVQTDGPSDRGN